MGVSIRMYSSSLSLKDRLKQAGCNDDEATGWSKEMDGWSDHSVGVFIEKLTQLNGKRPSEVIPTAAEAEKEETYVNPVTGEIGGPKGPEPTRYQDW